MLISSPNQSQWGKLSRIGLRQSLSRWAVPHGSGGQIKTDMSDCLKRYDIFSYSYLHSLVFLFALGTEVYFVFVLSLWALKCVARPLPSRSNPPSLLASIQPNIFLLPVANQVDTRSQQSAHIVTCSKIQTINPPKI